MSELKKQFQEASRKHGDATRTRRSTDANKAQKLKLRIVAELRKSPDKGQAILESLLEDPDAAVRSAAACYLLPLNEAHAIRVLEEVSRVKEPLIAFSAETILREWRAGRLVLP